MIAAKRSEAVANPEERRSYQSDGYANPSLSMGKAKVLREDLGLMAAFRWRAGRTVPLGLKARNPQSIGCSPMRTGYAHTQNHAIPPG